jgi:lysophospholipase L1-like esterase
MLTLSGFADRGGGPRRSPVEIVATMGSYLTRTQAAEVSGPPGRSAAGPTGSPRCARTAPPSPVTAGAQRRGARSWRPAVGGVPVAEISAHFLPPWSGKFASDCFHPSQDGYRDWARALLAAVPPLAAAA